MGSWYQRLYSPLGKSSSSHPNASANVNADSFDSASYANADTDSDPNSDPKSNTNPAAGGLFARRRVYCHNDITGGRMGSAES